MTKEVDVLTALLDRINELMQYQKAVDELTAKLNEWVNVVGAYTDKPVIPTAELKSLWKETDELTTRLALPELWKQSGGGK